MAINSFRETPNYSPNYFNFEIPFAFFVPPDFESPDSISLLLNESMDWCSHCLDACGIRNEGDFRCCSICGNVLAQTSATKSVSLRLSKISFKRSFILTKRKRQRLLRSTLLHNWT